MAQNRTCECVRPKNFKKKRNGYHLKTMRNFHLNIFDYCNNFCNFKNVWATDKSFSLFFKSKFLADMCPILGPLVPLFWIFGDISSGFQSQSGFCLVHLFCRGECKFPEIHLWCYNYQPLDGITAGHFPTCISRGGSWLRFEWAIICTEDK